MTTPDLAALRKVAESATPGPWYTPYGCDFQVWVGASEAEVRRVCVGLDHGTVTEVEAEEVFNQTSSIACGDFQHQRDCDFIAAFDPPTVLALLDRIEAAEQPKPCGRRTVRTMHPSEGGVGYVTQSCVLPKAHGPEHRDADGITWIESVR